MIREVGGGGGLGLGGPRGQGSSSVSKGPKPPIQLLQLLKNSRREVKRAHFVIYWVPPGSHPGNGINGARRGRSLPVLPVSPAMTKLHLTTALCFPFRVYRPSCLNRQACDRNHAARPVCTRYEWDDRALRTSHPHVMTADRAPRGPAAPTTVSSDLQACLRARPVSLFR